MEALRAGATAEQVFDATGIDPWFLDQLVLVHEVAERARDAPTSSTPRAAAAGQAARLLRRARSPRSAACTRTSCAGVRRALGVRPVYKTVDTCAAEFAARTPYHYSSYDEETEVEPREQAGGAHPRQRAQPDRAGHRVRLLLRARRRSALSRRPATRPSWSTATPRRSRPTTTPATGSTSSR